MALSEVMNTEILHEHIDKLVGEFDKDRNGEIDISEFVVMVVSNRS